MTQPNLGDVGARRHLLVSQRLRQRRLALGLTQQQVVHRLARLGVLSTNKTLSSLEHGTGVDVAKLPELARVLDCSVTWLLGLTDQPHCWTPDPAAGAPSGGGASARPAPAARAPSTPGRRPVRPDPAAHPRSSGPPQHAPSGGSWILGPWSPER